MSYRAEFDTKIERIREEVGYGAILRLAKICPDALKKSYEFLSDDRLQDAAKLGALRAAGDIAYSNDELVWGYVFDKDKIPEDNSKELSSHVCDTILDAYRFLDETERQSDKVFVSTQTERDELNRLVMSLKIRDGRSGFFLQLPPISMFDPLYESPDDETAVKYLKSAFGIKE